MRRLTFLPLALLVVLSSTAHAGVEPQPNKARLGRAVVPTAEAVRLTLDPSKPDYSGSVTIDITVQAPVDSFQLHSRGLKLSKATLKSGKATMPLTWGTPDALERLAFRTGKPLAPGKYTLDIEYTNDFDTHATALYRMQANNQWYAFTQFEANEARQAFPCWDEPEFKIPWAVTLTVPSSLMALANTPEKSSTEKAGQKTIVYKTSPPMPSYLVAFAVGSLEAVPVPGSPIPTRIVMVKGETSMVGDAVKMTPPILAALEKYFGRPYPYEKLDIIGCPEYLYGAMENPGAITFLDRWLALDPKATTDEQRRKLATVLAHEFSHMWFGDLVTMEWWDDLWLNESFASWMGDKISAEVFPEYRIPIYRVRELQRAYQQDAVLSTRAIRQVVDETVNLSQLADPLVYEKGEAVLGMFESWVGPEKFRQGVVDYLNTYAWKNARSDDLWNALSKAAGQDLKAPMATFLDQPGVPLVSAELQPNGAVKLRQQRLLSYGTTAPSEQTWKIPLTIRFSDGTKTYTQRVLLNDLTQTVQLDPKANVVWLHPNADESGYYRWSVAPEQLGTMSTKGRAQLSDRERVGFVQDMGALLDAGILHGDDYMRSLSNFGDDASPEVVDATLSGINAVRVVFITKDLEDPWARYIRTTLQPALSRIGDTKKPDENLITTSLRGKLIATIGDYGKDPDLRKKGLELTKAYLANPASVDPALVGPALRLAAIQGDATTYADFRKRFETSTSPPERERFLGTLGFFRDPKLVDQTLQYTISGPLRPQEIFTVTQSMDTNEQRDQIWAFVQKNYTPLSQRIPPVYRVYLVYSAFGCTKDRIAEAKAFFTGDRAPFGTDVEMARMNDEINTCVSLREREGPRVAKMLTETATASK